MSSVQDKDLPISTANVTEEVKIRRTAEGRGAAEPKTVMQNWDNICQRLGDHPALYQKRPAADVSDVVVFAIDCFGKIF